MKNLLVRTSSTDSWELGPISCKVIRYTVELANAVNVYVKSSSGLKFTMPDVPVIGLGSILRM